MDCKRIKQLIGVFLDGELDAQEADSVRRHLEKCPHCQQELKQYQKSWDMLDAWKDEEPEPGYVSRFWTKLAMQTPWYKRILLDLKEALFRKSLIPVFATVCVLLIVGSLIYHNYLDKQNAALMASLDKEEIELLENIELAENFDLIENLDVIEDLEIIEQLNGLES